MGRSTTASESSLDSLFDDLVDLVDIDDDNCDVRTSEEGLGKEKETQAWNRQVEIEQPVHGDARYRVASRTPPPIPGLYVFPLLLPTSDAHAALRGISDLDHFLGGQRDQVMLFTRSTARTTNNLNSDHPSITSNSCSSLPSHVLTLLQTLQTLLTPLIPPSILSTCFAQPNLARQVILNLYPPGRGIAPHVDLPGRYADGIVGVSLTGGCVMSFQRVRSGDGEGEEEGEKEDEGKKERYDVYLPPRSVYVMTGESRWLWAHGIEERTEDLVEASTMSEVQGNEAVRGKQEAGKEVRTETVLRGLRVSATFRWMKEGADVLS